MTTWIKKAFLNSLWYPRRTLLFLKNTQCLSNAPILPTALSERRIHHYYVISHLVSHCSSLSTCRIRRGCVKGTSSLCYSQSDLNLFTQSSLNLFTCKQYSSKRKNYDFPELRREDLEESFIRGSGPGGQAVNQTSNCVVLRHIPSGIIVKCQDTRSLPENRKIARRRLQEKLDFQLHGEESFLGKQQQELRREKMGKRKRSKEKLAMKKSFKESLKEEE